MNTQFSNSGDPLVPDDVVLLDEQGEAIGRAPRLEVHTSSTPLHLAFSTYLFNDAGEVLITRRALEKKTWPGVWTNSCCGHPRPGETMEDAMRRRIREELGAEVGPLETILPSFQYRAVDSSGIVENEICPVSIATLISDVTPNPREVMDVAWAPWEDLVAGVLATPQVYSPWAVLQIPELSKQLSARSTGDGYQPNELRCIKEVDQVIAQEIHRMQKSWDSLSSAEVDVLQMDLPEWIASLMRDGKRFRVSMCFWGFVAAGGSQGGPSYDNMLNAAAALELLHQFALIHDDIMDESTSRRGRPSAHVEAAGWHRQENALGNETVFARNIAILAGDLAHMAADALIDRLPAPMRAQWYELCLELILGQRADLTGAAAGRHDQPHTQEVAKLKSGRYTATRPLQLGALAAGASQEVIATLGRAGDEIGQAFAYRDDVLGVWGNPKETGKPSGDDLTEGKATVILALGHEQLSGADLERLKRLGTDQMQDDDVPRLQEALLEAGVRDQVEDLIAGHLTAADGHLDTASLNPIGVTGIKQFAKDAAWRQK